ncbi:MULTISPECIES: aldo/keto reductase [unclassified Coleofasciculus]|uniref:aldo/keto reductase n=1 Tax=unclassified Coleofasciculus TaxID=2692782 RepID=UPI00187F1EA8|nr:MULTISPECIES: aldo/keto reductase [unclassified Coleofasciculus]MBE9127308.1 aldo/keto reductase [Coleofasciculus sp. LEGE 07081]MBE9150803.1 aldo/keto reductase [Coleofasciculus sp. LEGE 07092]
MQTSQKLVLPAMGCGTWAWGNRLLWGYDESMDEQLQAVFNLCVSNGVTLFDTGDSYGTGKLNGRSEQLLGQFSRGYLGSNQETICIATKLAAYPWRLTRESMVSAGKASAKRLGRNVDLVQMHWSTANYFPWQEWVLLDGLADLYEQGLVKGVGLSNYGPKRLKQVYKKFSDRGVPIATLQVHYSLLSTYPVTELGVKEVCDELGIKLIAYSPLALGLLTGKYSKKGSYPKGIRSLLFRQLLPGIQPLLDCLQEVAESRTKTRAQVALNWCICKGAIPIPGAKSVEQAKQNMGALGWQLDAGEIAELDKAATRVDKTMVQNIFQTQ